MEIDSYITGFIDGEGSFLVSFSERTRMKIGLEVRPAFTVSQHERSKNILKEIQRFFNCGTIRFNKRDRTWKYEVRSLADLVKKIIPHFNLFPIRTSKRSDFEQFKLVCELMKQRIHLSQNGICKIIDVAYSMNNMGARQYDKGNLLKIVSKMKV